MIMKRKPCLYDGTDMIDLPKNRMVENSPIIIEGPRTRVA